MGTNYYWHDKPCGSCGRFEVMHVGKSSAGWSFAFRGYRHELMNAEFPEWGYDPSSPFGFPVVSRADWRKVFTERPGELWNEYGNRIDENPEAWLDRLEAPMAQQQEWEQGQRSRSRWHDEDDARDWRDAEGFRFWGGEFS